MSDIQTLLVCAATEGTPQLHAAMLSKLAALQLDADDAIAVVTMLHNELAYDEQRQCKAASLGMPSSAGVNPALVRSLALGTMLSVPAMGFIKKMRDEQQKDEGWSNLVARAPELHQQDPERLRAVYDMLHSTAPSIAQNPVVAADVAHQMMAMPMIDVGSISRLATTGKAMSDVAGDGQPSFHDNLEALPNRMKGVQMLTTGKFSEFGVPVAYIDRNGTKCALNWSTPAMKEAGLTDAVVNQGGDANAMGSGTPLGQANNAFEANQNSMGTNFLPLDAVVRELLMKEQELSQREEMLLQQEQAMLQAQQQYAQMGPAYQQQTGVDPSTGQPAAPAAPAGPDAGAMPGAEAPPADAGQPADGAPAGPEAGPGPEAPAAAPEAPVAEQPPVDPSQEAPAAGAATPESTGAQAEGEATPGQAPMIAPYSQDPTPANGEPGAPMPAVADSGASDLPAEGVTNPETGAPSATGENGENETEHEAPGGEQPGGEVPPVEGGDEKPEEGSEIPPGPEATGDTPVPDTSAVPAPDAGAPMPPMAPEAPTAPAPAAAPMAPAATSAVPDGAGGITMTVPLPSIQITIKTADLLLNPNVGDAVDQFIASLGV